MIGRLHHAHEFERLHREGTRVRSGVLWCVMLPDPSYPVPSIAFAIGRSAGSAVVRNRIRRQVRALMRTHIGRFAPGLYLFGLGRGLDSTPTFGQLSAAVVGIAARVAQ